MNMASMIRCGQCHINNLATNNFCQRCGASLEKDIAMDKPFAKSSSTVPWAVIIIIAIVVLIIGLVYAQRIGSLEPNRNQSTSVVSTRPKPNLSGMWRGNWRGWDMHWNFREDGTGFLQQASFAGGPSHEIHWKINGNFLQIDVVPKYSNESASGYGFSGQFEFQGNNLSINHKIGGWAVYSRQ